MKVVARFVEASLFRGRHRGNPQGKDFGGFKGYLEGIWGNPSLVKSLGKTNDKSIKAKTKLEKKEKLTIRRPNISPPKVRSSFLYF